MITHSERKALLFLAAVVALGSAARVVRARSLPAPESSSVSEIAAQLARVDSLRAGGTSRRTRGKARSRSAKKRSPPESLLIRAPLDLDRASVAEIEALPRIGHVVATRIVANRDTFGAFGSLEQLRRVRGIGPKLSDGIRPYVTFSGVARPANTVVSPGRAPSAKRRAARASRVPDPDPQPYRTLP